ncbi:MAG: Crp/Fnr family transcriptional regulator [Bacteroidetes bacterium]|nr:Crp/Fnr family transcriptional regulator [Bacteroidota bacterium]
MPEPENLFSFLKMFNDIDQNNFELLSSKLKIKEFKKGEIIVNQNSIQKNIYFLIEGVHYSYLSIEDKKHIIAFSYPPVISAIPESFHTQSPSKHIIEALTNGSMFYMSFSDLQDLYAQSQQIERTFRKLTEAVLAGIIDRHLELHALSIEDRYRSFCKRSPQLFNLIPHKYIASYLNIEPTNFSKLFNSVVI